MTTKNHDEALPVESIMIIQPVVMQAVRYLSSCINHGSRSNLQFRVKLFDLTNDDAIENCFVQTLSYYHLLSPTEGVTLYKYE